MKTILSISLLFCYILEVNAQGNPLKERNFIDINVTITKSAEFPFKVKSPSGNVIELRHRVKVTYDGETLHGSMDTWKVQIKNDDPVALSFAEQSKRINKLIDSVITLGKRMEKAKDKNSSVFVMDSLKSGFWNQNTGFNILIRWNPDLNAGDVWGIEKATYQFNNYLFVGSFAEENLRELIRVYLAVKKEAYTDYKKMVDRYKLDN